ncbi:MAG: hypothetical protein HKL82_06125 [Acidimicrobiaceae bacterium]|nr:hypothetical protein [Acidimicrobiaceae bacterium]
MNKNPADEVLHFFNDPRLPAVGVTLIALTLYITLPATLTIGPGWILPSLEAVLVVLLAVTSPRRMRRTQLARYVSIGLIGLVSIGNIVSVGLLTSLLLKGYKGSGAQLFFAAVEIWLTNVLVYGLWFWEADKGGPLARLANTERYPDFLFAQMTQSGLADTDWTPSIIDYLYLSLTNATAFSPTDTLPLTAIAKLLMAAESLVSLLTVSIVAARAINILN